MQIYKTLFLSLTLLASSSCQLFSEKQNAFIKAPDNFKRLENKDFISENSFNAQFLNDQLIVFLKNKTLDHDESQIYLKDKNKITKLTHLKGRNFLHKPSYTDGEFLFISDNESKKYNLSYIQKSLEKKVKNEATKSKDLYYIPILPKEILQFSFDIYKQKTETYKQTRLTSQPTPDLWPVHLGDSIYFSRMWNKHLQIYLLNTKNNKAYRKTDNQVHHSLLNAKEHMVAWVEYPEDWTTAKLVVAKNFTSKPSFAVKMGKVQSIDIHPKENLILISSKYKDKQFELYVLDVDKSCLIRLSYLKSNEYWPSWHPSGQKFIYTSDLNNQLQVYQSQFFSANSCTEVSGNL